MKDHTYSNKGLVGGKEPTLNSVKQDSSQVEDTTINNGGKTDYYQLDSAPFPINDFDDFAEWRGLNGFQFNIGKVVWTMNTGRHAGTTYERDLNKIMHYTQRELQRLGRTVKIIGTNDERI